MAAPIFDKVVIVVFENINQVDAIKQPTFKEIANNGVFFENFFAVARPSLPNYIAMTAGSTLNIKSDDMVSLNEKSIVNLLDDSKKYTWKIYAENYPENSGCFLGNKSADGLYVHNHNPFISYTYITNDPNGRCKQIVNAQNHFAKDLAANSLPNYAFYIPNVNHNGHNLGIASAEQWLKESLYPLMQSDAAKKNNVLFILTFDESNNHPTDPLYAENKIYTAFYGPMVKKMVVSDHYNFYSLLNMLEKEWKLGTLGRNDKTAAPITDKIWAKKR